MNLTERRSPENNLSNLMRHRIKERHEMLFCPQIISIESFLISPKKTVYDIYYINIDQVQVCFVTQTFSSVKTKMYAFR